MKNHALSNYCTFTATYKSLKIYMDIDFYGIRSDVVQILGGGYAKVNTCS